MQVLEFAAGHEPITLYQSHGAFALPLADGVLVMPPDPYGGIMLRPLLTIAALLTATTPRPAHGQHLSRLGAAAAVASASGSRSAGALISVPDSVRQQVGYQHWKGGAIGAGAGALAGLGLALFTHGRCIDCASDSPDICHVTAIGAGIGGAFGFLVGLATPRYRWVRAEVHRPVGGGEREH
jgi:hypothetical protein